ncbi:phage tail protein [Vibrio parahaemolyticus]|uniref:phage tail protein n=1 Tax=Vibrio parahaemolyticus TaxID=670 RepID=UPI0021536057|nr:phage tail protein [Vibrio parahaemolyticus]
MANTTEKSILTAAGKALLAQLNAEEKPLIIDKMIFANVANRPEFPQPDDVVPTDDIVHQEQVEQRGRLSADSVIYSTTLTSDVGPFEFNWTGAYCSEYGVLVTIDHHALTPKTADEPGVAGNTLVRSVVLEYKDIAEITNITVDASSWQYNATDRMKKMDSDVAQSIIDQNGKDWFIEDGFLVTPSGSSYNIKAGAGYVSGNRVSMEFDRSVQVPNKPSFIYIDAHREGTPTGEQVTLFDFVITSEEKDDYIDSSTGKDIPHFVCKIAEVLADGSVSDLRPEGESASRDYVNETSDSAISQANSIRIFPANTKTNVEVGNDIPEGTDAIRYENSIWLLGKDKYGTITAIDTLNRTVTMIVVPENVEAVVSISKRRQFSRTLDFKIPSDFPDLQTAADELSAYQGNNKSRLRLIIEKDHKLTKGMGVFNGDFSNIEILSEDPIVYLDDNFVGVTEAVQGNVNGEVPRPPLIYGFNASMPELNAVIDMKNKHGSGYFGVNCTGFVHPDKGVINAGFRGVQWRSGFFFGVSTNFSGATGCGARVQKSGTMNVGGANLDYCCKTEDLQLAALYVSRGSICEFRYGTARFSGAMAILGRRSIISAANTDLSSPTGYAASAESVAHIDVTNAVCDSPATGVVYSRFGSTVTAGSLKITNPKENLLKYMYRVSDGGSITVNGGNTVDGQPITAQHIYNTTPNFNTPYGDGIIYHVDYQGVVESGVNSDGYWVKYADGRQVTLSGHKNVDTGDVLVGEFSGKIALPPTPLPFVLVNHISVEVVGRTAISGGGNRVFVHKCNGFYAEGNELKIQNTGVALDVEATDYTVKSVSMYVRVEGRWR